MAGVSNFLPVRCWRIKPGVVECRHIRRGEYSKRKGVSPLLELTGRLDCTQFERMPHLEKWRWFEASRSCVAAASAEAALMAPGVMLPSKLLLAMFAFEWLDSHMGKKVAFQIVVLRKRRTTPQRAGELSLAPTSALSVMLNFGRTNVPLVDVDLATCLRFCDLTNMGLERWLTCNVIVLCAHVGEAGAG